MNRLEQNLADSFKNIKKDVTELQNDLLEVNKKQKDLINSLADLKVPKKHRAYSKTKFIASKDGKKFHIPECPYAKNILPKLKLSFKSKENALNKGFKPCTCVN
jgi:hypothetical protein